MFIQTDNVSYWLWFGIAIIYCQCSIQSLLAELYNCIMQCKLFINLSAIPAAQSDCCLSTLRFINQSKFQEHLLASSNSNLFFLIGRLFELFRLVPVHKAKSAYSENHYYSLQQVYNNKSVPPIYTNSSSISPLCIWN